MALDFEYDDKEVFKAEDFFADPKELKRRARQQKKLQKKYKFSDKEHSKPGIVSSCLALGSLILLIAAIVLSVIAKGYGSWIVGALCAISFACSFIGVVCGLLAFRNTNVLLKYAWIGMIACGIIWLLNGSLIVLGL